jgi:hypothetical protein
MMPKPLGIEMLLDPNSGSIGMKVAPMDRIADDIWDVVEAALDANWTLEKFRNEAMACWKYKRDKDTKDDMLGWK